MLTTSDKLMIEMCEEEIELYGKTITIMKHVADVLKAKGYKVTASVWDSGYTITK